MFRGEGTPLFNVRALDRGMRAARRIAQQLGFAAPVDLIGTPHHENHAWFSFAASPFAREAKPVMVAVLDGLGDMGAISLYVVENGRMKPLYANNSVFELARHFLRGDLLDAGRLDLAVERGPLHGRHRLWRQRPQEQSLLRGAETDLRAGARRPRLSQPRPRQLAARHHARALHRCAQGDPRRTDRAE